MAREILTGARIFDGRRLIDGHALVIDNGEILAILPRDKVPDRNRREVPGIIAPAFIDLQVNGGGGVLFNATPTPRASPRSAPRTGPWAPTRSCPPSSPTPPR